MTLLLANCPVTLKIVKLFGMEMIRFRDKYHPSNISIELGTPPKPEPPVLIHQWLSTISVFVIRGAWDCVLCVTRQRWAQIKGFCQVLIRSAPMFVLQYQRLHDLLECVGAVRCRVLTLSPTSHRGVHSSKLHAN